MIDVVVDDAGRRYDLGRMKRCVQGVRSLVCVWEQSYMS